MTGDERNASSWTWKPDGSALAVIFRGEQIDLINITNRERRPLIEDGSGAEQSPHPSLIAAQRSLDGSQIAYHDDDGGVWDAEADGSGAREVAFSSPSPQWSPHDTVLIGIGADGLLTVRPDGTSRLLLVARQDDLRPGSGAGWLSPEIAWQRITPRRRPTRPWSRSRRAEPRRSLPNHVEAAVHGGVCATLEGC
jgi:hypothetical protein